MPLYCIVAAMLGIVLGCVSYKLSECVINKEANPFKVPTKLKTLIPTAIICAAVSAMSMAFCGSTAKAVISAVAFITASCVSLIDIAEKKIYNAFAVVLILLAASFVLSDRPDRIIIHLLGAAFALISMLLLRILCAKAAGREALGIGDVLIGTAFGLHLGILSFCFCGMIACVTSFIWVRLSKKASTDAPEGYPFAPSLTAGFAVAILSYEVLMHIYFG